MDNILEVKDVTLTYKFYKAKALKHFLLSKKVKKSQKFQALNSVSFNIKRGTNVGIIGSNGSGKSTLLRILANTLTPDSGSIKNTAKSVSLLSLGVGFQADLTGHENVYLNGLLLGLSKDQIEERMNSIIDFAELGDFIYNPVRTYSSGMKSRLSFSIAINVEPELLLIDEIFSVGDEHFRKKSGKRMEQLIQDHRTVVMVSHSLDQIKKYCTQVIWIEGGKIMGDGEPEEIIEKYLQYVNDAG